MFLLYYGILSIVFYLGNSVFSGTGYSTNIQLNSSELTSSEVDTGGVFSTGVNFGRFFGFLLFGVGLPDDTPSFFTYIFVIWQSCVFILALAFIISSIWNG
jgi:hypothetical protein